MCHPPLAARLPHPGVPTDGSEWNWTLIVWAPLPACWWPAGGALVFEQDVHADVRLCDELRLHPPILVAKKRVCILNVCALGHEAPSVSQVRLYVCFFFSAALCAPRARFSFSPTGAIPPVSSLGSLTVLLPYDSSFSTRQLFFQLIHFSSFAAPVRDCCCLLVSHTGVWLAGVTLHLFFCFLVLASHVFKIMAFVSFVPICCLLLPVPQPVLFLMHRKCVSSGVYQVCALRTVPDSMSQVGSGRRPEFCAVGIMSVVSVRALVEAYMYGLCIRLYRRGSLGEIV